ncbi:hypothetical protein D3C78_1119630 [compost metagenome]
MNDSRTTENATWASSRITAPTLMGIRPPRTPNLLWPLNNALYDATITALPFIKSSCSGCPRVYGTARIPSDFAFSRVCLTNCVVGARYSTGSFRSFKVD